MLSAHLLAQLECGGQRTNRCMRFQQLMDMQPGMTKPSFQHNESLALGAGGQSSAKALCVAALIVHRQ